MLLFARSSSVQYSHTFIMDAIFDNAALICGYSLLFFDAPNLQRGIGYAFERADPRSLIGTETVQNDRRYCWSRTL
jgi:hypothetical protein